ncbi:hypothetical protein ID866_9029 [Astraeus odoratus]|nr:hypothetical protein ID866_9029 [Astraeus odoratus]
MAIVQSMDPPRIPISPVRDSFASSGRGGSGNIRHSSIVKEQRSLLDGLDGDSRREREGSSSTSNNRVVSIGRGGAGNVQHSPDLADHPLTAAILLQHWEREARREEEIRKRHAESTVLASSGRGGMGNINSSRRSRSRPPSLSHTTNKSRSKTAKTSEHSGVDALDLISRTKSLANLRLGSGTEHGSRRRMEPGDDAPCSPTSAAEASCKPSRKRRTFLKMWNKGPSLQPLPSESDILGDAYPSDDASQRGSHSSMDYHDISPEQAKRNSRGCASTISSYSSGSRSIGSSHISTRSLPMLSEGHEYVSFLDL